MQFVIEVLRTWRLKSKQELECQLGSTFGMRKDPRKRTIGSKLCEYTHSCQRCLGVSEQANERASEWAIKKADGPLPRVSISYGFCLQWRAFVAGSLPIVTFGGSRYSRLPFTSAFGESPLARNVLWPCTLSCSVSLSFCQRRFLYYCLFHFFFFLSTDFFALYVFVHGVVLYFVLFHFCFYLFSFFFFKIFLFLLHERLG